MMICSRFFQLTLGLFLAAASVSAQETKPPRQVTYDVVLRGGTVYNGSGNPPRKADVGIVGDEVHAVGDLSTAKAKTSLDVGGLAVAPGFINMLSWSNDALVHDGRSQSEIRQ